VTKLSQATVSLSRVRVSLAILATHYHVLLCVPLCFHVDATYFEAYAHGNRRAEASLSLSLSFSLSLSLSLFGSLSKARRRRKELIMTGAFMTGLSFVSESYHSKQSRTSPGTESSRKFEGRIRELGWSSPFSPSLRIPHETGE